MQRGMWPLYLCIYLKQAIVLHQPLIGRDEGYDVLLPALPFVRSAGISGP
jgi:hypothetical protein